MRIGLVAEERFSARGFVEKAELARRKCGQEGREVLRVVAGLIGNCGQRGAFLLYLDDADGDPIDNQ